MTLRARKGGSLGSARDAVYEDRSGCLAGKLTSDPSRREHIHHHREAGRSTGRRPRVWCRLGTEGGCQPVQVVAALGGVTVGPDLGQRAAVQS
jgi:hypothetical protein